MGLAGPRKRVKISHDPNNTAWTRSTTTFGHKILTSQGWTPGQLLGPENASHAAHHTAANASHIRVVLKDDTLGLGAKTGNQRPEDFGLDVYASVLGRLNGKGDDVMRKEERYREDVRRRLYADGKFGGMRFVSGGILEKDVLLRPMNEEMDVDADAEKAAGASLESLETSEKESEAENVVGELSEKEKKRLRKKEKKRLRELAGEDASAETSEAQVAAPAPSIKQGKRDRKKSVSFDEAALPDAEISSKEKRRQAKKDEKARRKEEKRKMKEAAKSSETSETEKRDAMAENEGDVLTKEVQAVKISTVQPLARGRQLLRQRNIMQKRMATMNATAMNEIFMIKS